MRNLHQKYVTFPIVIPNISDTATLIATIILFFPILSLFFSANLEFKVDFTLYVFTYLSTCF